MPYNFYDQQIAMAEQIMHAFTSGEGELYGILIAQMQSGKSGTYFHIALKCIHRKFFDKVYIICGSRDTSLRDQTKNGLDAAIEAFVGQFSSNFSEGMAMMRKLKSSVQVKWNQELKDVEIGNKCLIINDESHTAQSKVNIPYKKFWKKNGLEPCLYGDFSPLRERNIRILSVSATSFSECVENQKVSIGMDMQNGIKLSKKNVFIMDPGESYTGVVDFLRNRNIKFTSEPINEKTNGSHLRRILMDPKYERKYCVVRTACAGKDYDLVNRIAEDCSVLYKAVYGDKIKDSLSFLDEEPRHTTLVHICGIARMGQELNKEHIGFVYEQSKNPNIDTLLQGLLGRVCGHNANKQIDIFISGKREGEVREYAAAMEMSAEESLVSLAKMSPAMNVKGGAGHKHTLGDTIKDLSGGFWRKMVPVKFSYSLLGQGFDSREITHIDLLNLFTAHPELIVSNPDKQFIMDELEYVHHADIISNRDLKSKSYIERGTAHNLDIAIQKDNRCTDWFTNVVCDHNTPEVKPFTVLYNKSEKQDVYFTGFSPHTTMTEELWNSRMGMKDTLKKCNYNPAHVIVTENKKKVQNVNGGQLIQFPQETSTNEVELHKHLREAIIRSIQNPCVEKEIASLWCDQDKSYKGIRLYKNVFTQEMIDAVKSKLDDEFQGIKVKFIKGKGRQSAEYFRFSSISW